MTEFEKILVEALLGAKMANPNLNLNASELIKSNNISVRRRMNIARRRFSNFTHNTIKFKTQKQNFNQE